MFSKNSAAQSFIFDTVKAVSINWVQFTFWYARCDLELCLEFIKSVSELGENANIGMH